MGDGKSDISVFGSADSKDFKKKRSSMNLDVDDKLTDLRVDLSELKKEVARLDKDKLDKNDFEMMLEKFSRGKKESTSKLAIDIPASTPGSIDPESIKLWNKAAQQADDVDETVKNFLGDFNQAGGVQFLIKVKLWIQEL